MPRDTVNLLDFVPGGNLLPHLDDFIQICQHLDLCPVRRSHRAINARYPRTLFALAFLALMSKSGLLIADPLQSESKRWTHGDPGVSARAVIFDHEFSPAFNL